jgi:DNA polymerase III sliding clamp (beta) subunit (PCNA family)
MTISYVTFMKHAEKVTKTASASRPALKGVFHSKEGSLIATDSHRLYVAKNAHAGDRKLIDAKTGASIEGNYPDVSRLIPDASSAKYTVRLDVKQAVDVFKVLLSASKLDGNSKYPMTSVSITDDGKAVFTVDNNIIQANFTAPYFEGERGDKITFNSHYFVDALSLFKDAGVIELTMRYYGATRPFTLAAGKDDDLLALLLPIRTGAN